jgi:hypothetical protein
MQHKDANRISRRTFLGTLENGAYQPIDKKKGNLNLYVKEAEDVCLFSENLLAAFQKLIPTSTTGVLIDQSESK